MPRPWRTLASIATPEGALELRQRGEQDFLIVVGGRVLMTSSARRSEEALATLALARVTARAPRVLIGGLGLGYTLRAALDALPAGARITVAELNAAVVDWCRGPLAVLTAGAASDPRVVIEVADVAAMVGAAAPASWDAVLLDLYEGPNPQTQDASDPFYGDAALARTARALAAGGVFAVWAEDPDPSFLRRLRAAGFDATSQRVAGGGRAHHIYLAAKRGS